MDNLINHPGIIIGFAIVVILMLMLDLGVFNKKNHEISNKEALIWSLVWIGFSMIFSLFIYFVTDESSRLDKFSQYQALFFTILIL
jgi:tellurite resistance protein TerC